MSITKPFEISKRLIYDAWKKVKSNNGSYGIDLQSIEDFEEKLGNNLYKIWNRMSSGSYFPPPVKTVAIPKKAGGERILGIPTVSDRVAQMATKIYFEPLVEPNFHEDSYGYRPEKSAIQAVAVTRKRCWQYNWLLEFDIKGLFDNIEHDLLMKAVTHHTRNKWILLYIERWLNASFQQNDGTLVERTKGTPQGGVISPVLANLFLHYVFDKWVERNYPQNPFCRYADDGITHCRTEAEAKIMLKALDGRFKECGLELHPGKTKIVYCKDDNRRGEYSDTSFDFLSYTFRPRKVKSKTGQVFTGFSPAIADKAKKRISKTIRGWKLQKWSSQCIEDIAIALNPVIRGWINYYGHFYKSELLKIAKKIDFALMKWAKKKFRKMKRSYGKSRNYLKRLKMQEPRLFVHWHLLRY